MITKKIILFALPLSLLVLPFQNCEDIYNRGCGLASSCPENPDDDWDDDVQTVQRVVSVIGTPRILRFGSSVGWWYDSPDPLPTNWIVDPGPHSTRDPHIEVDLQEGFYQVNQKRQCPLPEEVQETLFNTLEGAGICETHVTSSRWMSCMAESVPDLQIVDEDRSHVLSLPYCDSGLFLCHGGSIELRDLLHFLITESSSAESSCVDIEL